MTDRQKTTELENTVREVVRLLSTAERGAEYLVSVARTRLSDVLDKVNGTDSKSLVFYYGDKGKCLFADTPFTARKFKVKEISYGKWGAFKKNGSRYEELDTKESVLEAEACCVQHYQQSN